MIKPFIAEYIVKNIESIIYYGFMFCEILVVVTLMHILIQLWNKMEDHA